AAPIALAEALFEWSDDTASAESDPFAEYALQREAVDAAADPASMSLLLAAESAGALAAAEMRHAGLPWSRESHEHLLTEALGARPDDGRRPPRLDDLARQLRELLDVPELNPDSPPE